MGDKIGSAFCYMNLSFTPLHHNCQLTIFLHPVWPAQLAYLVFARSLRITTSIALLNYDYFIVEDDCTCQNKKQDCFVCTWRLITVCRPSFEKAIETEIIWSIGIGHFNNCMAIHIRYNVRPLIYIQCWILHHMEFLDI